MSVCPSICILCIYLYLYQDLQCNSFFPKINIIGFIADWVPLYWVNSQLPKGKFVLCSPYMCPSVRPSVCLSWFVCPSICILYSCQCIYVGMYLPKTYTARYHFPTSIGSITDYRTVYPVDSRTQCSSFSRQWLSYRIIYSDIIILLRLYTTMQTLRIVKSVPLTL